MLSKESLFVEDQFNDNVWRVSKLQGTTLLVYWYLVAKRRENIGPRELQRALGFGSPSTALFHLRKLASLQFIEDKGNGTYHVTEMVKVGIMRSFVSISRFLIPKALVYAGFTSILLIVSGLLLYPFISGWLWLAWLPSIVATLIFFCEGILVWRLRPHFNRVEVE